MIVVTTRWLAKHDFEIEYVNTKGSWQKAAPCLKILKLACKWPGLYKQAFLYCRLNNKVYNFKIVKKDRKSVIEIEEIK